MNEFQPVLGDERKRHMRAEGLWADRLLTDCLDDVLARDPQATAIVEHRQRGDAVTRLSYAELDRRARSIAAALAARGVESGDVVAVQLPNWWHYAALHLACVRIGAVINPLMPIFRERELEFMLSFAGARVLVVPREFRGFDYPAMVAGLRTRLPALEQVYVVDGDDPKSAFETQLLGESNQRKGELEALFAARRPDPNDVTEIMYTSGTTGQPKGVMHTANTLLCKAALANELFAMGDDEVVLMGSPVAHQTGFMYAMVFAIYRGMKCVLQDVWDPVQAARLIAAEGATITLGSTPFLSDLVDNPGVREYDTSSLRLFLCAGAPIPRVLVERSREIHPQLYVMSAWGMTEMGIATATRPGDPQEKVVDTDGCALPGQAVRVVDDNGAMVPSGTEGRLQSRCATTFVGYLKRPEAYGMDDDFWFETGDNARMDDDGYIRITGRSKDIIIRGGENIPVVEIEELLYRHPAIEDAAVVAMPDERLGERGCAFVTLREGEALDFDGMIDYLESARLARQYWPERLERLAEFPRTASGKIQKFALREQARALTPMHRGTRGAAAS